LRTAKRSGPAAIGPGLLAWWALCLLMALPAWWMGWVPLEQDSTHWPALAQAWAHHPDAGLAQPPWVWWSAAWLHGSALHLWRNLAGVLALAWLGWVAQVDGRCALIWGLSWPLTQLGMLGEPTLHTYIGLSGVLHGGVATVALHLVGGRNPALPRWTGWLLLGGLCAKVLMENPCGPALIQPLGSDITVAPWAHVSGSMSAVVLSLVSSVYRRWRHPDGASQAPRTLI